MKAISRVTFEKVVGLWSREANGIPFSRTKSPTWVKEVCITTFKIEVSKQNTKFNDTVEITFSRKLKFVYIYNYKHNSTLSEKVAPLLTRLILTSRGLATKGLSSEGRDNLDNILIKRRSQC